MAYICIRLPDKSINKHLIHLHFIVFLWGFTPLLGRIITLNPVSLIWYRCGITFIILWIWFTYIRKNDAESNHFSMRDIIKVGLNGVIIAVHWIFFYKAIQISNISVTMMGFSTGTLFSAIIEPLVYRRKFRIYELLLGLGIIGGVTMIFYTTDLYREGLIIGILAALTSSIFATFNGLFMKTYPASFITRYQMLFAFSLLSAYMLINGNFSSSHWNMDNRSLIGMLVLTLVCTVYPYIATLNLMKHITPFTITLTVNLETIYGITWGILIFNEHKEMTHSFFWGMGIILVCVFLNPILKKYFS
ncbi:MAG: DMT family transporter [Bacteroidia bacterium]|nr:DMT family transporter [Bacteroidia bacterium]